MVKMFAKKSKKVMAATAFLFATAFQTGACSIENMDVNALLDSFLQSGGDIRIRVNGQGGNGGPNHGPDDSSDGMNDNSDGGAGGGGSDNGNSNGTS